MSEKEYKLLKNFTPRDLYEAQASIELFLTCMERRAGNIDSPWYHTDDVFVKYGQEMPAVLLENYEPWIPWLIENKFIEEIEEEIELKPGMILEQKVSGRQYIMTNNGLYYGCFFPETWRGNPAKAGQCCKTLQELNKRSGYKWRVLY